ncbi:4-(cytidine 5'-diphospho)-2-C-methyl-D-erythritol kinase [Spiribacter sp. C176]|uniref:4-diphosphocytidyl-2-C-methyl-D-erythritol kinase n=1 Tax=Spiribacter salilacus TaxID=2664894 RepID=A0A6N7QWC1_9GAMM|nr:4-(cytidine 5'-diphospho)-2-C-methyl-D-erythritol kinase [Spiribacter salilacus]MRH78627.1 4-(cytidine 5'-diphospho)-2-C-methyl-D-erythritol kinase [Spiribacter salilacus]
MSGVSHAWPAPAKINRFLHITGRRPDGYHTLQTAFQFAEPVDELTFTLTEHSAVERTGGIANLPPAQDLVVKAAELLRGKAGITKGVSIHVEKRIPIGGGLGGGSSNAATTLVALNHLWGCELTPKDLMTLALQLGADVPVFVGGVAAWADGVGEVLTPLSMNQPWLLMVNPGVNVQTAVVFHDSKLTRNTAELTIRAVGDEGMRNDCEPVVRRLYPKIAAVLDELGRLGAAKLTGTGGCAFAEYPSQSAAEAAQRQLSKGLDSWVCRAKNRSPLCDRLAIEGIDNWGVAKR